MNPTLKSRLLALVAICVFEAMLSATLYSIDRGYYADFWGKPAPAAAQLGLVTLFYLVLVWVAVAVVSVLLAARIRSYS